MENKLKLGRILGIPVGLHWTWFLIFALVTWSLALGYFPDEYPTLAPAMYWLLGAITSVLFFGSVLLHELGHLVGDVNAVQFGLLAEDGYACLQVGGLNVGDQTPSEAGAETLFQCGDFPRGLVAGDDDLPARFV